MQIQGKQYHTIWLKKDDPKTVRVIDQRKLPFRFEVMDLRSSEDAFYAIREMVVRGAPLIGVTAAYGMFLAMQEFSSGNLEEFISQKADYLKSSRPTAVNLSFAVDEMKRFILNEKDNNDRLELILKKAHSLKVNEIEYCEKIGNNGLEIIRNMYQKKKDTVNILTHCNAGWLACIDWGTATAPIYKAHREGIPVHVWVDETRPRNQGARLTAFELGEEGVKHTVIPDNTGGHLMQHGKVDLVIVGSDRTTASGDVANKIGTYQKALAAKDNNIPFYAALPSTTIDWKISDGLKEIPIEERHSDEVAQIEGWNGSEITSVCLVPKNSPVANYGFDVTPARLVTGLITERGVCAAGKKEISRLFPEKK